MAGQDIYIPVGKPRGLGCGADWALGIEGGRMLEAEGWEAIRGGEGEDLTPPVRLPPARASSEGALAVLVIVWPVS